MQTSRLKEYRAEICKVAGFTENPPAPFLAFEEISYQPELQCEVVDQEQKTLEKQVKNETEQNRTEILPSSARPVITHTRKGEKNRERKRRMNVSWLSQELEAGDIIVVQEELADLSQFEFPNAKSFLQHIKNLRTVILRRYDQPSKDVARIRLSKKSSYKEVAKAITTKLNIANGPDYIRIFQLYSQVFSFSFSFSPWFCVCECLSLSLSFLFYIFSFPPNPNPTKTLCFDVFIVEQNPRHIALPYNEGNLERMLEYSRDSSGHDALCFEEIDIPLPEFEKQKEFENIIVVNSKLQEIGCYKLRLDSERTVADLIQLAREKVNKGGKTSNESKEIIPADKKLRLVELCFYRVNKVE